MVHYTNSTSHYASVDTIHITDDVIVSGPYMLKVIMLKFTISIIRFLISIHSLSFIYHISILGSGSIKKELRGILISPKNSSSIWIPKQKKILLGSRDRGIHLWPLYPGKEEEGTLRPVAKLPDAHQGWVWSLSSTPHNDLVSGAWDSKIKFWKVTFYRGNSKQS